MRAEDAPFSSVSHNMEAVVRCIHSLGVFDWSTLAALFACCGRHISAQLISLFVK